jgi:hypothetical protein
MNENGHQQSLVPSHPGNRNNERSSAYARRNMAQDPEVRELAEAIMAEPHTVDIDRIGPIENRSPSRKTPARCGPRPGLCTRFGNTLVDIHLKPPGRASRAATLGARLYRVLVGPGRLPRRALPSTCQAR